MHNEIKNIEEKFLKKDIPDFSSGDTVAVHLIIKEKERERVQIFQGVVIKRKGGGLREAFTVRKVSFGVGVEKVFPLHLPLIKKIEVLRKKRARRANLTYMKSQGR